MSDRPPQATVVNFEQVAALFGGGSDEAVYKRVNQLGEGQAVIGRALAALEDAPRERDVLCAPNDQAAALLQTFLAERAAAEGKLEEAYLGAMEARFDSNDIGWIRAFVPWVRSRLGIANRAPRPALSDQRVTLDDHSRIAILGDWGTASYGAPACANSIARDGSYQALIHLGDVYYTGSDHEINTRFIDIWPQVPNAVSRACNSNHEMYSGGGPYFSLTLPKFEQPSSVFILENQHWVVAGLDTAYNEHDLDEDQMSWLARIVSELDDRRLILMSHHQPFSLLSRQGPLLQARLRTFLVDHKVFAWYWGHEHLFAVYEKHPSWALYGRCVGHSGYPYFRPNFQNAPTQSLPEKLGFRKMTATVEAPAAQILDGSNEYLGDRADRYGPNGYMRLEFEDARLHEVALAANGVVLWENDLM